MCRIRIEGTSPESKDTGGETTTDVGDKAELSIQTDQSNNGRYSPAVLKLSQEHGIDLNRITGSGAGGRITRKDILKAVEGAPVAHRSATPTQAEANMPAKEQQMPETVKSQETMIKG